MTILLSSLNKQFYKPGEVAKLLNLTTRTIQSYCTKGILEEVISDTNKRTIPHDSLVNYLYSKNLLFDDTSVSRKDAIYARVSTHSQKNRGDLERQIDKIKVFVSDKNPVDLTVYSDVASGLNDSRKGLSSLINDVLSGDFSRIFILYRDRLTRFGFNYLKKICDFQNVEIIVIDSEISENKSIEEELAQDIISIIHSFNGKLHSMRIKVKIEVDKGMSQNI